MKSGSPAPNRSLFASIRAIRGLTSVSALPPSRPLMSPFGLPSAGSVGSHPPGMSHPSGCLCSLPRKRPVAWFPASARWHVFRHPTSDSGSALILTLLITALLATIAVSFLSTSRVEQIAAKNFSRQNAAAGLAELATQQAMGKIQLGFNTSNATSGTGSASHTQVTNSQPGRITKYFFLNGNCTGNATTNLYSTNGTVPADLNNLQNPGNTTQIRGNTGNGSSTNQTFTITGNASNRLIVNMEDITSNGTLIGRVAYYTDDELTKININGATDNRTTLNVSTARSMSLSAITTGNLSTFRSIIDGTISSNTSSINNWGYFFRKEQADKVTGFNGNQMSNISTAPLSDFHLKYTPWGTRRLHINDEPLNATGVNNVYEALAGLNATTGNISASPSPYELNGRALRNIYGQNFNDKYGQNWSWTGNMSQTANTTVNGLKQTIANMLQMRAPGHHDKTTVEAGYTGPVISENGTATFPPSGYYAHVPSGILNEFAIKIDYNTTTKQIYIKPFIEITCPFSEGYGGGTVRIEVTIQSITYTAGNATNTVGPFTLTSNLNISVYTNLGITPQDRNAPFIKCTFNSAGVPPGPLLDETVVVPSAIIGNPTVTMGDVKLYAGTSNSSDALRDWLEGSFINEKLGNGSFFTVNTPLNVTNNTDTNNYIANFNSSNESLQRIDPRIKGKTAWVKAPNTFSKNTTTSPIIDKGRGTQSWDLVGGHNTLNSGYGLKPVESATSDIPGDPSSRGLNDADFYTASEFSGVYFVPKLHTLDATNNATFNTPHDLGKVPTNVNWRRLRFMPRHQRESARNLIPDWAMLDVISFSSNNSSRSNLKIAPINPNGNFALDTTLNTSNATIPSPRNNLAALIKPLESSDPTNFKIGSAIAGANMPNIQDLSVEGAYSLPVTAPFNVKFRGATTSMATSISSNITSNSTTKWSTLNSTWSGWRTSRGWPSTSLVLPGEVTEIRGVADYGPRHQYLFTNNPNQNNRSIKENEGRLSAFFPGLTTCSNFFTIYAYAQALDKTGNLDSEALTKTLVEVEITTPATETDPAEYKVKKLYTQPIPLGQ